ncbi:uncharacterized protein DSM5745_01289 [Aspergillus mulundensis]|uniref:Uncharacterized protein n=1 Tax=Aspergillus mulundensis TaxID=1810919 RepID=A0A3D8T5Y4_9EURO|nr:hypothetical protein DSM5745_01289 [Aspergillus mulundensis]RDW93967.1 hypothetical protein DSM5745_01289 [Aspergillus mulundensis]
MSGTSWVESPNAKETALALVLGNGSNRILWEECRLAWDTCDLLDEPNSGQHFDGMAAFGVRGRCKTPAHEILDFQLRSTVFPETPFPYRLHAIAAPVDPTQMGNNASGFGQGGRNEVEIVQPGLGGDHAQLMHLREMVGSLTYRARSMGLEGAIKWFMTLGRVPVDSGNQSPFPNGVSTAVAAS